MKLLRRLFLLLLTTALLIIAYAYFIEPNQLVINRQNFDSPKINQPLKIVVFSDTHFGKIYAPEKMEKIVAAINKEEADLVLFAGDFFDIYAEDKELINLDYFETQLNKIEAKVGKYAIWGNRDYGGGVTRFYQDMMSEGGFEVLRDTSIVLPSINLELSGLDDYLLGSPNLNLSQKSPDLFQLALFHEPDLLDELNTPNYDLALAGHSHGGQIRVPFLTDQFLPFGGRKYVKGFYTHESLSLFVTSGIGLTKIPFRFLNAPEIVSITLSPVAE